MTLYRPILKRAKKDNNKIASLLDFLDPNKMEYIGDKYGDSLFEQVYGYTAETFNSVLGEPIKKAVDDPSFKNIAGVFYKPAFNHLGYVFETMDRVTRPVRGLATELGHATRGNEADFSFDNIVTESLSGEEEFSGQEVIGAWKGKDPKDTSFWSGLLVEILLDPTTYVGVGLVDKLDDLGRVGKVAGKGFKALDKVDSALFKISGLPMLGRQVKKIWKGKKFVQPKVVDDVFEKVGKDLDNNVDIMGNYKRLFDENKITKENYDFLDKLSKKGVTNDDLKEIRFMIDEFDVKSSNVRQFATDNKISRQDFDKLEPVVKREFGDLVQKYGKHIDNLADIDVRFATLKSFGDEISKAQALKKVDLKEQVKQFEVKDTKLKTDLEQVKIEKRSYGTKSTRLQEDLGAVDKKYNAELKEARDIRDAEIKDLRIEKQETLKRLRSDRDKALTEIKELKVKKQTDLANRKAREVNRLNEQIKKLENIRDDEILSLTESLKRTRQNVLDQTPVKAKPKPKRLSQITKDKKSYKKFFTSENFNKLTKTTSNTIDDIPSVKVFNKNILKQEKTLKELMNKLKDINLKLDTEVSKIDDLMRKVHPKTTDKFEGIIKPVKDKIVATEQGYRQLDMKLNTKYQSVLESTKNAYRADIEATESLYDDVINRTLNEMTSNIKFLAQEKQATKEALKEGYKEMRGKLDKRIQNIKKMIKDNKLPNGVKIKNDAQNEIASVIYDFDLSLNGAELERVAYSIPADKIGQYVDVVFPDDPVMLGNKLTDIVKKFKFETHNITDFYKKQHSELKKVLNKISGGSAEELQKVSKNIIRDVEKDFYKKHSFKFGDAFKDFGRSGHWEVSEVTDSVRRFVDETNKLAGEDIITVTKFKGKKEYYRIAPNKEIDGITDKINSTWTKFEKKFATDELLMQFNKNISAKKVDIPREFEEEYKEARKLLGGIYENMRSSASLKQIPVYEGSFEHMAHVLGDDMNNIIPHYDEATYDIMNVVAKKRGLKYIDGRGAGRTIKMSIEDANNIIADNLFSTDINYILEEAMRDSIYKSVNNMLADATLFNGDYRIDFLFDSPEYLQKVFKHDSVFRKKFSIIVPEYTDKGMVNYRKINWKDTEALTKAFNEGSAMIIDTNTLVEVKTLKDFYGFNNKFLTDLREYGVGTYKSLWLCSTGFHLMNAMDITVKNMVMSEKGIFKALPETIKNYHRGAEALRRYDGIMKRFYQAYPSPSMWNLKSLDDFAKNLSKDDRKVYELVSSYKASRAQSSSLIHTTKQGGTFRKDAKKGKIKKTLDYIKSDNIVVRTNFKFGETIEDVGRMGLWIGEQNKGKSNWEIINSVVDTHFDYTNKPKWMYYGEFIMPFLTFPINNFKFWANHGLKNYNIVHTIGRGQKALWQGAGYDYDNPPEHLEYLKESGAIPLNKKGTFIKTGSSLHDAINMLPPTNEVTQRIHPFFKVPINLAVAPNDSVYYRPYTTNIYTSTLYKDDDSFNPLAYGVHQLNPFERQIRNFSRIPMKWSRGQLGINDLVPSVFAKDYYKDAKKKKKFKIPDIPTFEEMLKQSRK